MISRNNSRAFSISLLLSILPLSTAHATAVTSGGATLDLAPAHDVETSSSAPVGILSSLAPTATVIRSSGAIEADLNAFRALLGNPNNNGVPGEQTTGHREVNWDGVPAALTNSIDFPNNFFNANSTRGLVYDRTSRGLQVSDRGFSDIEPTYAAEFSPFSGGKVFSPRGTNKSDVRFFVPGSGVKAAVRGFGVVFMDVDTAGSTGILLLADDGTSLGRVLAPVRSDARGASFVGVVFRNPLISRVRIVTGNAALATGEIDISQGGQHDVVVMDDFVYGEPTATR